MSNNSNTKQLKKYVLIFFTGQIINSNKKMVETFERHITMVFGIETRLMRKWRKPLLDTGLEEKIINHLLDNIGKTIKIFVTLELTNKYNFVRGKVYPLFYLKNMIFTGPMVGFTYTVLG